MASLCTLCASALSDDEGHVALRVTSGCAYKYHAACFDKVGRGVPTDKLKLTSLGIFTEIGRVVDVERRDAVRRCCLVDCLGKSDAWYGVTCSRCDITHIHKECYESKEENWLSLVRAQRSNNMNDATLRKAMFSGKYDIIRMACPCRCGLGFFRVDRLADEDSLTRRKATALPKKPPQSRTAAIQANARKQTVKIMAQERKVSRPKADVCVDAVQAKAVESARSPLESPLESGRPLEDLAGLPPIDESICPILRLPILRSAKCSDGYYYEEVALRSWLSRFGTSPISCLPAVLVET